MVNQSGTVKQAGNGLLVVFHSNLRYLSSKMSQTLKTRLESPLDAKGPRWL